MKPILAIVGRPNVGKSTLFNRLTQRRDAIVADVPGVTRDRHYGEGRLGARPYLAIDTGGLDFEAAGLGGEMTRQAELAIAEADAVIFIVDARAGLTAADRRIGERLRKAGARVRVAANKAEGMAAEVAAAEFHELALGAPAAISAAHGEGVRELIDTLLDELPDDAGLEAGEAEGRHPRVAVVGRPNVGKSTLVNALVGEARVIAFGEPGTTRDPIKVPFEHRGRRYTLVDTAGLRRRGRTGGTVEKFSIVKTLQAIEACNVCILLLDASEGVLEQDAHVAGFLLERGRALVVALNKWDAADREQRERMKAELAWKLGFLGFAPAEPISAQQGKGLGKLMQAVDAVYAAAMAKLPTPKLTRALRAAVERQEPPRRGVIRPKLRYAHQGGMNPPRIIIHGSAVDRVPESYRRYLENVFRKAFGLQGTPLAVEFRAGRNPYAKRRRAA